MDAKKPKKIGPIETGIRELARFERGQLPETRMIAYDRQSVQELPLQLLTIPVGGEMGWRLGR